MNPNGGNEESNRDDFRWNLLVFISSFLRLDHYSAHEGSMKIDLGCGDRPYEDGTGWTHMDERELPHVEIVGDVADLDMYVENESCSEIMARHILEHFSYLRTSTILKRWWNCLERGGILTIEVPNLWWQCNALVNDHDDHDKIVNLIYGGQDYSGNYHKAGFTGGILLNKLGDAGFRERTVSDIGMVLVAKAVK